MSTVTRARAAGRAGAPVRRALGVLAVLLAGLAASVGLGAGQTPPRSEAPPLPPRLVYGGDREFPPFEYLDAEGRPQGFNVELVRAIAARVGIQIDIQLTSWPEAVARFERHEIDLVSMAYSDVRAERYALLPRTWTLDQVVMFEPGRTSYPDRLDLLQNETVAVEQDSVLQVLLEGLPEVRRPALLPVESQRAALDALVTGQATAVVGNSLALRYWARQAEIDGLVSIPVKTISYHLATQKDRAASFARVADALAAIRDSDGIDRLVEQHLVVPDRQTLWHRYATYLAGAALVAAVLLVGVFGWNRSLARQVGRRTSELGASEARSRSLIHNMLGGLITLDESGRIETVNPAGERIFGYNAGELVGRHVSILVPEGLRASSPEFLQKAFREAIGRVTEWEGRRKNGELFPLELSFFEFSDVGGRHFAGNVRDISERREVDRLKNEFVSTVSHELRTPLTSIKGAMQLLLHDESLEASEDRPRLVGVALNNTERLIRIVNDMLDVAKIEAGRLNLQRRRTAVGDLVRTSMQNVEQIARGAGVGLVADVADGLPAVDVDPDRMVQALVNLLSNALKFAPEGSDVMLAARPAPEGRVTLSVSDRGPGIPPAQLSRLFQKFQQLDGGRARTIHGTGLGLAITRALVEQHGGRIDVESAPGAGTTFRITLVGA